jgi:hypothetical protein
MRYSLSYRLTVAGGLCALVAGMAAIDADVRNELVRAASGQGPSPGIASIGWRLHDYTTAATHVMGELGIEHSALVMFGLGAMVILVFMLRIRL